MSSQYFNHGRRNFKETLYNMKLKDLNEMEITEESSATLQEVNGRMVISLHLSLAVEGIIGIKDGTIVNIDEINSDPYFVIIESDNEIYITNGEKYYRYLHQKPPEIPIFPVYKTITKDSAALVNVMIQQYKHHLRKHFG